MDIIYLVVGDPTPKGHRISKTVVIEISSYYLSYKDYAQIYCDIAKLGNSDSLLQLKKKTKIPSTLAATDFSNEHSRKNL